MNIKRVKYKMNKKDNWKIGYIMGEYDGQNKILLDENLNYIPKIIDNNKEFTAYDIKDDFDKRLNIIIPI